MIAVERLSFTVKVGKITGFLGPSGSGKSTAMCMVVGLDALCEVVTVTGRA